MYKYVHYSVHDGILIMENTFHDLKMKTFNRGPHSFSLQAPKNEPHDWQLNQF
jgi:hypothetical protein